MTTALDQTFAGLVAVVGASQVTTDEHARTQLSVAGMAPKFAVQPGSAEEVAEVLHYAAEHGLAVIPFGNATKLVIGNPPHRYDIALSLKELNRVCHHEPADLTVSVESGMKFGDFQHLVGKHGLWLPLDPAGGVRASLGGILAANASGSLRTCYGTARDMTLGMKIATTEGKIIKAGGRVVKNVAGYDLTKLMIGSFGTLGVIVEASFKLFPLPTERASFVVTARTLEKAREIRRAVQALPIRSLRFVLLDAGLAGYLRNDKEAAGQGGGYEFWVEVAGTARVLARCEEELKQVAARAGETFRLAPDGVEENDLWRHLGELGADVAASGNDWLLKASLPIAEVEEFLSRMQRCLETRGGNLRFHADPLAGIVRLWLRAEPERVSDESVLELRNIAGELSGSLIVELAPAAGKVDTWGGTGDSFEVMQKLKDAWDPKHILSPGRFVSGL